MNTKQNEFIIGITVSLATLMVIVGLLWLGKSNFLKQQITLHMKVESTNGLQEGDEVHFRGVKVGMVKAITFVTDGVIVRMKIDNAVKIPKNSEFLITGQSLIGEQYVDIKAGNSNQYLQDGALVQGIVQQGSISNITSQFGQIQGQLQQVLANLENMSSRENITLVRSALLHLNRTTAALDSLVRTGGPVLLSAVNNVNEISAENKEAIQSFMASLQKNSQSLAAVLERTHQSASRVDSLLSSIQRGQGNLGRLYSSDSLYIQLEKALTNIDSLFQDIRNHPGKYFNVRIF